MWCDASCVVSNMRVINSKFLSVSVLVYVFHKRTTFSNCDSYTIFSFSFKQCQTFHCSGRCDALLSRMNLFASRSESNVLFKLRKHMNVCAWDYHYLLSFVFRWSKRVSSATRTATNKVGFRLKCFVVICKIQKTELNKD